MEVPASRQTVLSKLWQSVGKPVEYTVREVAGLPFSTADGFLVGILSFVVTLLLFASMEVISKPLMGLIDPLVLTFWRFVCGIAVLGIVMAIRRKKLSLSGKSWCACPHGNSEHIYKYVFSPTGS